MVNSMVTVTCEDNYLVDRNMIDQQVLCTLKGWDSRDCHKVCLGEPLVGNATTTWRDDMWLVNDTINATCLEGYHFIEANTTEMLLSCEYDGWEDLLACEKGRNMQLYRQYTGWRNLTACEEDEPVTVVPMSRTC
ncbi:hypothetical protein E2C01_089773 [Portunus trituberculatus]|uniref:Sushi domain-containing protein n=1 Tax=Portunus trituberculatus TaxID=210409 RepID=A0A5B7JK08_PORTR|nr:hypothetical protein [Portunus trituberculatus]